jgi:hypothetical protein
MLRVSFYFMRTRGGVGHPYLDGPTPVCTEGSDFLYPISLHLRVCEEWLNVGRGAAKISVTEIDRDNEV